MTTPTVHYLKIDQNPLHDIIFGKKTCEVRVNDRNYKVGDYIVYNFPTALRSYVVVINHIQSGYGLPDNLVVLSIQPFTPITHSVSDTILQNGLGINKFSKYDVGDIVYIINNRSGQPKGYLGLIRASSDDSYDIELLPPNQKLVFRYFADELVLATSFIVESPSNHLARELLTVMEVKNA